MSQVLPVAFYARPALKVARELLGKVLVHQMGDVRIAGRIVETEAYIGEHDLACHASKGRTPRTDVLFGPPGRSYIYLIYGMYHCFNVVTDPDGIASAVLVRGVEPIEGIAPELKTNGPGKLCRAMHLTLAQNRLDLAGPTLSIEDAPAIPPRRVDRGPRIGVEYAKEWAQKPYRLWVKGSPGVSKG